MEADKREFLAGAFEGFAASVAAGAKMSGEDFWQTYHGLNSWMYRDMAEEAGLRLPVPLRMWAEVLDEKFAEADKTEKELGPYMDKDHLACIKSLAYQRKFASPEENARDLAQAEKEMEKLLENARKKKAQAEQAAKEEAEYQARKAANRQARASAPEPEVKALPAAGKLLKKDDDDMSAFCGAGSGKKGKRK